MQARDAARLEALGLTPPEILIFFKIPKTGSSTMDGVLEHCFPGQRHFHAHTGPAQSALLIRPEAKIAAKYQTLTPAHRAALRCVLGVHLPMGIHRIFDRPAKYVTILRHPVDRAISNFYYNRTQPHLPSWRFIKDMTLDQYLDSGIGLDARDHQVRMLSGCPELDAPWDPEGRPIIAPPVERRHLELAKRHIEERFIAAAPTEELAALVLLLRQAYGWPLRRVLFRIRNETRDRPPAEAVSPATRQRLLAWNRYDLELYEWVRDRFARQVAALEPDFSRDRRRFARANRAAQALSDMVPEALRRAVAVAMFRGRTRASM